MVDKEQISWNLAWNALLMRFENTLSYGNFRGPRNADDKGIVICDNTEGEKLTKLIRKMRHYNTIPHMRRFFSQGASKPSSTILN